MKKSLENLIEFQPPTQAGTICAEILEKFSNDPDLLTIPIVSSERPVGLVNRHEFIQAMAHQYGRALYDRQPVEAMMDTAPLVVEVSIPLETLNRLIVDEKPSALLKGFIVTRDGDYLGIGTALSLLQLTNAVMQERARELDEPRLSAEQASASKSRFLATMSHELRTPLNAVMGFSELIEQESYGPVGDPHYIEYAGLIRSSGEHLLTIIEDVLDMSRIEAGKLSLREVEFAPAELAERCMSLITPIAQENGVSVGFERPDDLPNLIGDHNKLQQVTFNLLTNAVKFTPNGGTVRLRMNETDAGFMIAVIDTGIGIDPEDIPRVLQPFVQAESSDQRSHGGTGLGLPLSHSLVEMHGGKLQITSTKGVGTTVTVALPRDRIIGKHIPLSQAG